MHSLLFSIRSLLPHDSEIPVSRDAYIIIESYLLSTFGSTQLQIIIEGILAPQVYTYTRSRLSTIDDVYL